MKTEIVVRSLVIVMMKSYESGVVHLYPTSGVCFKIYKKCVHLWRLSWWTKHIRIKLLLVTELINANISKSNKKKKNMLDLCWGNQDDDFRVGPDMSSQYSIDNMSQTSVAAEICINVFFGYELDICHNRFMASGVCRWCWCFMASAFSCVLYRNMLLKHFGSRQT